MLETDFKKHETAQKEEEVRPTGGSLNSQWSAGGVLLEMMLTFFQRIQQSLILYLLTKRNMAGRSLAWRCALQVKSETAEL